MSERVIVEIDTAEDRQFAKTVLSRKYKVSELIGSLAVIADTEEEISLALQDVGINCLVFLSEDL